MENVKKDIDLWNQIRKGDAQAYNELYDRYIDSLFTFGIQYTNDETLVQDAIHDIFIELHKYRKTVAEQVQVKSYLFKSLHNDILRKLKMRSKTVLLDDFTADINETQSIEEQLILGETTMMKNAKLELALNSLTEKQRYALNLRFTEDLSYEEISSALNISLESCRTLIYRSLKDLRLEL